MLVFNEKIVRMLRNDKATGAAGVTGEMFKYGCGLLTWVAWLVQHV